MRAHQKWGKPEGKPAQRNAAIRDNARHQQTQSCNKAMAWMLLGRAAF
jgi:hypothetical protein